jgi:hypothetical protein
MGRRFFVYAALLFGIQVMNILSEIEENKIAEAFTKGVESFTYNNEKTGTIQSVCCAVCDGIPTDEHWWSWIEISFFKKLCLHSNMAKAELSAGGYPQELLMQYTASDPILADYVLSPCSIIDASDTLDTQIIACNNCIGHMKCQLDKQKLRARPPAEAIANGFLIGEPPVELTELTEIERSIVADIRIYCQSWAFFAGAHQHIKGWHTFYSNRPEHAVANLEQLKLGGLKGQIMVVLCGRFTTTQRALTMKKTLVNAERVIKAFEWLKKNNFVYKDIVIPDLEDIPLPVVIDETM